MWNCWPVARKSDEGNTYATSDTLNNSEYYGIPKFCGLIRMHRKWKFNKCPRICNVANHNEIAQPEIPSASAPTIPQTDKKLDDRPKNVKLSSWNIIKQGKNRSKKNQKSVEAGQYQYDYIDSTLSVIENGGKINNASKQNDSHLSFDQNMQQKRSEKMSPLVAVPTTSATDDLYTSGSQIYSICGDDYGSIISDRRNCDDSSVSAGYSRILNGETLKKHKNLNGKIFPINDDGATSTRDTLESLYSKIIRHESTPLPFQSLISNMKNATALKSDNEIHSQSANSPAKEKFSSNPILKPIDRIQNLTCKTVQNKTQQSDAEMERENSSSYGSSSIALPAFQQVTEDSNSMLSDATPSCPGSYRYLTVRENVDSIRQRLAREQANHQSYTHYVIGNRSQHDENRQNEEQHYYSTIANEYESVDDGSQGGTLNRNHSLLGREFNASIEQNSDNHFASSPTSSANPKLALHVVTTNNLSTAIPKPPTSPIPIRNGSDQNVMLIDEEYTKMQAQFSLPLKKPALVKFQGQLQDKNGQGPSTSRSLMTHLNQNVIENSLIKNKPNEKDGENSNKETHNQYQHQYDAFEAEQRKSNAKSRIPIPFFFQKHKIGNNRDGVTQNCSESRSSWQTVQPTQPSDKKHCKKELLKKKSAGQKHTSKNVR